MGYTNSTTNYHLPQFIGTDKPSWLGDVNSAMNAIDTQMKVNADDIDSLESRMTATETVANSASTAATNAGTAATSAQSTADSAATAASNAASAASNAQTTANAAQTAASTADGKAVSAQSTATNALTKANANEAQGGVGTGNYTGAGTQTLSFASSLRPTSSFTINCAGLAVLRNTQGEEYTTACSLTIGTDGTITTNTINIFADTLTVNYSFWPCLYWVKDFGDTPITPEA